VIPVEFLAVKPCKYDAFEAVPKGKVSLDLDAVEKTLSRNGYEILTNPRVMLVVRKGAEITIYPHGRLLMHPVSKREEAESLAKELYSLLGM
jgi:ArsR family metal-binding transcriptional regulator